MNISITTIFKHDLFFSPSLFCHVASFKKIIIIQLLLETFISSTHNNRYHNSQAVVISSLQVAKHPFITPGPASVFTPPPMRHSTLPGVAQGVLAGMTMTGSLPYYYGAGGSSGVNPVLGLKHSAVYGGGENGGSVDPSSGYPTPRPGSSASGFDMASFYMGSPQIGGSHSSNLFRSFPKPHSSPKMKLRL